MNIDLSSGARQLPTDAIVLQPGVLIQDRGTDLTRPPAAPLDEGARDQVSSILPAATVHPRRIATWEQRGVERQFDGKMTLEEPVTDIRERIVIADPAMIDLYELSTSERADLESTGALLLQPWFAEVDARSAQLVIETAVTDIVVPFAMRDHVRQAIENRTRSRTSTAYTASTCS